MKLSNKVALITGAGGGIGADTARLFAKLGATLSLLSTTEENLSKVASECEQLQQEGQPKPLIFVGSVANMELCKKAVDDTVKTFGKIDILVNNAGIAKTTSLLGSAIEDYDDVFNINLRSVILLTQYAVPHLINSKGCVINVSSILASRVAQGRLFYGMSKASLNHFTRYIAQELGQYKVRVNTVSPGFIRTKFPANNYGIQGENLETYYEKASSMQVMNRCGEGNEIADAIAFLASDEASFITGTELQVDGGFMVQIPNCQAMAVK